MTASGGGDIPRYGIIARLSSADTYYMGDYDSPEHFAQAISDARYIQGKVLIGYEQGTNFKTHVLPEHIAHFWTVPGDPLP